MCVRTPTHRILHSFSESADKMLSPWVIIQCDQIQPGSSGSAHTAGLLNSRPKSILTGRLAKIGQNWLKLVEIGQN